MYESDSTLTLIDTIADSRRKLADFCIHMTPEMEEHIVKLYPNDIAIENYLHSLILHSLE